MRRSRLYLLLTPGRYRRFQPTVKPQWQWMHAYTVRHYISYFQHWALGLHYSFFDAVGFHAFAVRATDADYFANDSELTQRFFARLGPL